MINNLNISNLQVFNKEGHSLPCTADLQEAIQIGIAKKAEKLLNAEGFLALIPNFDPTEDTKLRIHLTKDGITIQLLERDSGSSKTDRSYSEDSQLFTDEIKKRKEKIITKVDSLFKEPPSFSSSTKLESEKIHPLPIPSQANTDKQVPFKIGFDATISNPQIQQLHVKIEDLQDQLNKKTPYSEELQLIKHQLQFLSEAIHNLSINQENIIYPRIEEYALINKLVDSQRDIYQALLDLLSRNLNHTPITPLTPSPAQGIENLTLKEMIKLQQKKIDLEQTRDTLQSALHSKDEKITDLKQQIQDLPTHEALQKLHSQLEILQSDKAKLQLKQDTLNFQLNDVTQTREGLEKTNTTLQSALHSKDEKITDLTQQIQDLPTHEALQKLQFLLETSQSDKAKLQAQQDTLNFQLNDVTQTREDLKKTNTTLQSALLSKDEKITDLKQQIQDLPTHEALQKLQSLLETSQSDKAKLQAQLAAKDEQISKLNTTVQYSSLAYQELEKQIKDEKEISNILETAVLPEKSSGIALIEAILEETKQEPASLENSIIPEELLTSTSDYYTLTAIPPQKESLETPTETTGLQMEINDLQEELKSIRPIAYDTTNKLEKMQKATKALTLELSEKTRIIENLGEEKDLLEARLKDLQMLQHTFKKQQKEISVSSEENNDLLKELQEVQGKLASEKRERAKLERTYEDQLEKLEGLHKEDTLRTREIVSTLIKDLDQKQPGSCILTLNILADYVKSGSITNKEKEDTLLLFGPSFKKTNEYKISKSSDGSSSDEETEILPLDGYEEDNIFLNDTPYQNH